MIILFVAEGLRLGLYEFVSCVCGKEGLLLLSPLSCS
jgi:hypothetical protein